MALSGPKRLVPPSPPTDFSNISLDPVGPPQRTLYRLSHENYPSPLFYSRQGIFRFDSSTAKWGVCYLAQRVETACLEVFADAFRTHAIDYSELRERMVWKITVPADLELLLLKGEVLPRIRATVQCFVSRYTLSQAWGRAFMQHPADLDGVIYDGRQSGDACLALFGDTDPKLGRWHQSQIKPTCLGRLTDWNGFYSFLDKTAARVNGLPSKPTVSVWSA